MKLRLRVLKDGRVLILNRCPQDESIVLTDVGNSKFHHGTYSQESYDEGKSKVVTFYSSDELPNARVELSELDRAGIRYARACAERNKYDCGIIERAKAEYSSATRELAELTKP